MVTPAFRFTPAIGTLVFGPQALAFDEESASQLRFTLLNTSDFSWALNTIAELSGYWDTLLETVPRLKHFPGEKLLEDLNEWLKTGKFTQASVPLPNILLTPLVVITHLTQYMRFLELIQPDSSGCHNLHASFRGNAETLGLCTGLLSAAAVSCSADRAELQHYSAVAVRLAMLVGALVDGQDLSADLQEGSKSFSVAWTTPESEAEMTRILKTFPEAYVSVLSDKKRATVTASTSTTSLLQQQLKGAGVVVAEVGLRGSFHCQSHRDDVELLLKFCDSHPAFQLLDASEVVLPTRSNTGGDYISSGKLHHIVLRSILMEQSNWHQSFDALQSSALIRDESLVVCFGPERCIPSSLVRKLGPRMIQVADLDLLSVNLLDAEPPLKYREDMPDNAIAVVGMSCKLPGAADLEEFWKLLCAGKSQHVEVPDHRFGFETSWRDLEPKRKWYGNFIQEYDTFDHKFFKKSPREMASTDPQHRLMLQAAYQAVEQSGYFSSPNQDKHIGCYIGVGLVDYENNIACHAANAYSATGNLKAFVAGKISHYFGWTGPGLTIDTACSSSAVAVHSACRAILSGECTAALAGGVNVMTSPKWFQNLAGASFLSPTGQCKPFDIKGDGYCRGEGVGAVFLKKLSSAVADGDQVFGVIAGTAVYQNQNCTPITVPNMASLSNLFGNVIRQARLEPNQISVVEAHGTGTPVGDPAEYDSIRRVFEGSNRSSALSLGSVKGLVGHTESASGIVALLKTLLMVHERAITPQASFTTINPSINASPSDKIEITTSLKSWDGAFRAALINNYGASGSNAALVVTQPPISKTKLLRNASIQATGTQYPFWFCGLDEQSLRAYSAKFLRFLATKVMSAEKLTIANLAFQLSRQSNRSLSHALILSCSSVSELETKLAAFGSGHKSVIATIHRPARPVILCFGGQISKFVGLDQQVYESINILRRYLDQCNAICQSFGLDGIYPEIFQRSPIEDTVKLQTALFALQYSCAKCWIDCGIEVAAVVGHSFGELTGLCVSGVLSLQDALKMIAGRARIIKDSWGAEKGSMMAVEAELVDVERLLTESSKACHGEPAATIACFNGPKSFTLAGTAKAINVVSEVAVAFPSIRSKKLNVTNAFHSTLVEPLMAELERLGQDLALREPRIPLEMATEVETMEKLNPTFIAAHMRRPVYLNHAVLRLLKRYPSCIWLEAGSNSTITTMVSRALGSPTSSHFQPINLTGEGAFRALTDATTNLWREGLSVSFWPHHSVQTAEYDPLFLPPYQFEKAKHWMELKKPQKAITEPVAEASAVDSPKGLWTFVGYQDSQKRAVRFRVNTMIKKFADYVSGHRIAQTALLCPSTLQLDIAIDALMSLRPDFGDSTHQPQLQGMDSHAPMSLVPSRFSWLDAETIDADSLIWDWKIISESEHGGSASTLHVSGRIIFRHMNDPQFQNDFAKYERLVGRDRCLRLLEGNDVDEVIQGRNIYKTFAEIVEYAEVYRGVQRIVGKGNESAGRVVKEYTGESWLDTGLADSFCQVAGIFVNSMTDRPDNEMYISDRIDQWIRSPNLHADSSRPEAWEVFACHHRPSDKRFVSDVFIFDPRNGALLEAILGIRYQRVSKAGLGKMLAGLTSNTKMSASAVPSVPVKIEGTHRVKPLSPVITPKATKPSAPKKEISRPDISGSVRQLLSNLSGLEAEEIKDDSDLIEIGIDSLMSMELAREIEIAFKCTLATAQLIDLTDFQSLIKCIQNTLSAMNGDATAEEEKKNSSGEDSAEEETPHVNGVANGVTNGVTNGAAPDPSGLSAYVNGALSHVNGINPSPTKDYVLHAGTILEAFAETKRFTDGFIAEHKLGNYIHQVLPRSTELCLVHILDAFEELGCSLRDARPGQKLERIQYLPKHEQFMEFVYNLLWKEARLININGSKITRTAISPPAKSAEALLQDLIRTFPDHASDHKLTYLIGVKLADCLTGKADGLQLIFGTSEGREVASAMYGQSPINVVWIKQIEDFLKRLVSKLPTDGGPIKILEMGAGTGGTTARMVPLLASLGVPVQYTVTDISSSLVAAARKRFKGYASIMEYRVFDIEAPPVPQLLHSQHIVLATNCVHATHSLAKSTKNIHDVLRPDGFLLMLEMTETLPWIDLIFGLLEGWWLFDDGRRHALAPPAVWDRTLQSVGYGHVDWTEGNRPEANVQRIIIALASSLRYNRVPILPNPEREITDFSARQAAVDVYLQEYTRGFSAPSLTNKVNRPNPSDHYVLLTGATGNLGSHLVEYFSKLHNVKTVICLNRYSSTEAALCQQEALKSRGISLEPEALAKLKVYETDTAKPKLNLASNDYDYLINNVTHIVHNAWPMNIMRPTHAFESQFKVMQNLIELAREIAHRSPQGSRVGFQFISSIATVGYYPLWSGKAIAPEERMTVKSVLPTGYGDAKLVCERMLDETLHRYPDRFRPMAVRIGQIAGSKISGYWNPVEHFAFITKWSQTLKVLPNLEGTLSWCPVNTVAAALGELLLSKTAAYPIYHIENPVRQPWREMILVLADALDVPRTGIIPFDDWVDRVRRFPGSVDTDNSAGRLVEFLARHFVRMSCGGLILGTKKSTEHSETLRGEGAVSAELMRRYVSAWKEVGFLHQ